MLKRKLSWLAAPALLLAGLALPAQAQYQGQYGNGQNGYYNGVRQGGHSDYGNDGYHHYDDRRDQEYYNQQHHGGIGPGKGAAIGAGGGALLGGLLGGGLKGALIGGAAGGGIGAIAGKEHQNSVRRNDGYYGR